VILLAGCMLAGFGGGGGTAGGVISLCLRGRGGGAGGVTSRNSFLGSIAGGVSDSSPELSYAGVL